MKKARACDAGPRKPKHHTDANNGFPASAQHPLDRDVITLAVYAGQHRLGTVVARGNVFEAIGPDGRSHGYHSSRALPDGGAE